jgi:hypothetical protein
MSPNSSKVFSLAEANELVSRVADLTASVVMQLDSIRQEYNLESEKGIVQMPQSMLKEVEKTLSEWSNQIVEMGAAPKGYFTVDFQSLDPELLYCWTYGEERIKFTHKVWENFSHRRPLAESAEGSTDHLKWVN